MAQKTPNKTLVKDFGSLSPLHEETEISRNSSTSDPSRVHEFPLLRLWDRCSDGKNDVSAACSSQDGSLLRTHPGKEGTRFRMSDLMTRLSRKSSTQSKSSRMLTAINPNVRISRGLPAFEKQDSLIRRTPNESTSSRSSAHGSLPKSLPKSLAKVLPKALPKVFSALTHRGAKNKSFEDTQTNVDTLPANQNGLVYGSTGAENIEDTDCPLPGGNDCANENNQTNGDDCDPPGEDVNDACAREDADDAREDGDNASHCGDRDDPSNVYHDAADAAPVLSDCNDIEPAACGPTLSESNHIDTVHGGPVLSDFNDTAPTSHVETYTTFYCSNSSVGGEAGGYSGGGSYGGSYGGGYDGGYGGYDGGSSCGGGCD